MPTTHRLKTDPRVFIAVANGLKTFEIRKNDRNFQVGDELVLQKTQYSGADMAAGDPLIFTGDELHVEVTYILKGPIYGLAKGWVIMSISPPIGKD